MGIGKSTQRKEVTTMETMMSNAQSKEALNKGHQGRSLCKWPLTKIESMGHTIWEMVPTRVRIWGEKRLGRSRGSCWFIDTYGVKDKESTSTIASFLKWEWWIKYEWFCLVFDLPIIFFAVSNVVVASVQCLCLWRDIKATDCCRTCCLPYSEVLKWRLQRQLGAIYDCYNFTVELIVKLRRVPLFWYNSSFV